MPAPGKPNILITGTPGVGKSMLCAEILKQVDMECVKVGDLAKNRNFMCGYDEVLECPIIDEDKVLDEMETLMAEGGKLVEYHSCSFFPERWFDAVFVLTANNTVLYDRLKARGYNEKKIRNNVECEIFEVIYNEALDSYDENIVHKLQSETDTDMERNIKRIVDFIQSSCNAKTHQDTGVGEG